MKKLKNLLQNLNYRINKQLPARISSIKSDSRNVEEGSLFFALKGTQQDGHEYLAEAVNKGALAAVVEEEQENISIPQIIVEDSRDALSKVAANFYGNPTDRMSIIGITGTNGKTSTVYLLRKIIERSQYKVGTIGTLGYTLNDKHYELDLTTPDIIQLHQIFKKMLEQNIDIVVMEVSSHAIAMERINNIVFDGACFTNLSEDHLDFHESMEKYANTKVKLFTMVGEDGFRICNIDDEYSDKFINTGEGDLYTTSYYEQSADYHWSEDTSYHNSIQGIIRGPQNDFEVTSPLSGIFSLQNITSSVAIADRLKISKEYIQTGLKNIDHIPGRMQEIGSDSGPRVFVDYAHTPDAIQNVLAELKEMKSFSSNLCVVFGCGGDREKDKRPLMSKTVEEYADYPILTMDNPRDEDPDEIFKDAQQGFSKENTYQLIKDRKQAIYAALEQSKANDIVAILGKGHEDYQIIKGEKYPFNDAEIIKNWFKEYADK